MPGGVPAPCRAPRAMPGHAPPLTAVVLCSRIGSEWRDCSGREWPRPSRTRKAVSPVQRSLRSRISRLGLLAGSAVMLTGCTVQDVEDKLRFGWPRGVTHQAERMRDPVDLVLGRGAGGRGDRLGPDLLGCWRYRKTDDLLPTQTKYHLPIEIAYSIAPFVIIAVLFYFTAIIEDYVDTPAPNPDTVVQVTAFKWNWQFEYKSTGRDPRHRRRPSSRRSAAPMRSRCWSSRSASGSGSSRSQGRRPLLLGAGAPVQARRVPDAQAQRVRVHGHPDRARTSAGAPSSAAPTTRR